MIFTFFKIKSSRFNEFLFLNCILIYCSFSTDFISNDRRIKKNISKSAEVIYGKIKKLKQSIYFTESNNKEIINVKKLFLKHVVAKRLVMKMNNEKNLQYKYKIVPNHNNRKEIKTFKINENIKLEVLDKYELYLFNLRRQDLKSTLNFSNVNSSKTHKKIFNLLITIYRGCFYAAHMVINSHDDLLNLSILLEKFHVQIQCLILNDFNYIVSDGLIKHISHIMQMYFIMISFFDLLYYNITDIKDGKCLINLSVFKLSFKLRLQNINLFYSICRICLNIKNPHYFQFFQNIKNIKLDHSEKEDQKMMLTFVQTIFSIMKLQNREFKVLRKLDFKFLFKKMLKTCEEEKNAVLITLKKPVDNNCDKTKINLICKMILKCNIKYIKKFSNMKIQDDSLKYLFFVNEICNLSYFNLRVAFLTQNIPLDHLFHYVQYEYVSVNNLSSRKTDLSK